MQLIEAALAFAITMLALSMICSSIIEMIHRAFKMREAGLEYMLGQLFDQVMRKYLGPMAQQLLKEPEFQGKEVQDAFAALRAGFLEQMTANRSPVGLSPDPKMGTDLTAEEKQKLATSPKESSWDIAELGTLWGGRRVTSLTTAEFMERLGAIDIGRTLAEEGKKIGEAAADSLNVVMKDVAQKFEGFGKDAAVYFEGRARFMSVMVAIVVAFLLHVDAIDLFKTYLRDPSARAEVIKQSEAITAQYKAAQEALAAQQTATKKPDAAGAAAQPAANTKTQEQIAEEVEALRKDVLDQVKKARETVKQFADLGLPIGWKKDVDGDTLNPWAPLPVCTKEGTKDQPVLTSAECPDGYTRKFVGSDALKLFVSLILGGLLVGLGAPFWYNAVTGLTNLRNTANGLKKPVDQLHPLHAAENAQPITPVGAFKVASRARAGTELPPPPQNP